jgi:hypothetical protein
MAPIASEGPGLAAKHADRCRPVFQTMHGIEPDGAGIADHGARAFPSPPLSLQRSLHLPQAGKGREHDLLARRGPALGFAVEQRAQVPPAIAHGFDELAADRDRSVQYLLAAQALVEEARRVGPHHPDQR